MIKIIIADDHPIFREGLKKIIEKSHDIEVADEAQDGRILLNKLKKNHYNAIVLDISMPGVSGLDVLKELKAMKSKVPVLILSMHPEEQYAVRALRAGAAGYLTKTGAPDEIAAAIRKVVRGGKYISASLAEKLAFSLDEKTKKEPHERLSDREFQVMRMICSGKALKEIANELFLSVPTISTYRARILEKTNLKNNAELIRYCIENGIFE